MTPCIIPYRSLNYSLVILSNAEYISQGPPEKLIYICSSYWFWFDYLCVCVPAPLSFSLSPSHTHTHTLYTHRCIWLLAQLFSRVWLCEPMDCSPAGSSVHGISQARILECVTISYSRGSSWPRDRTLPPALQAESLMSEPSGKPSWEVVGSY